MILDLRRAFSFHAFRQDRCGSASGLRSSEAIVAKRVRAAKEAKARADANIVEPELNSGGGTSVITGEPNAVNGGLCCKDERKGVDWPRQQNPTLNQMLALHPPTWAE